MLDKGISSDDCCHRQEYQAENGGQVDPFITCKPRSIRCKSAPLHHKSPVTYPVTFVAFSKLKTQRAVLMRFPTPRIYWRGCDPFFRMPNEVHKDRFRPISNSAIDSMKPKLHHRHRAEGCERKLIGDAHWNSGGSNGSTYCRKDRAWGGTQSLNLKAMVLIPRNEWRSLSVWWETTCLYCNVKMEDEMLRWSITKNKVTKSFSQRKNKCMRD